MARIGNVDLVEHGIQTEQSDLRVHVCPNAGKVYVFPTKLVVEHIKQARYTAKSVYTVVNGKKVCTAKGYVVPVENIPGIRAVGAATIISGAGFREDDSTSEKGNKAVFVVENLIRVGHFPLATQPEFVRDATIQKSGTDLIVSATHRLEVKCDYNGGSPKTAGVTGNLFLQFAECNPLGMT